MYKSILVPLDGSVTAEWALPAAISVARRQNATIKLLTIERTLPGSTDAVLYSDHAETWRTALEDESLSYLGGVAQRIAGLCPVTVERDVRIGIDSVGDQVVQYARDANCDLIVMATHGYGPFKRFWLGSVADAVVRHSDTATLLVRPIPGLEPELQNEPQFRNIHSARWLTRCRKHHRSCTGHRRHRRAVHAAAGAVVHAHHVA
jgi:nucleotide-binding universal stress UspA family protein